MTLNTACAALLLVLVVVVSIGDAASADVSDAAAADSGRATRPRRGANSETAKISGRSRKQTKRISKEPQKKSNDVDWLEFLDLSGATSVGYYQTDKQFSDRTDIGTGFISLISRPREFHGLRFYIDGQINYTSSAETAKIESDLRELFVEKSFADFDFKLGRQINVWGRADRSNPTDSFSVRDMTKLVFFEEDQRTGVTASQVTYNSDLYRFIAIAQHEWREPKFALAAVPNTEVVSLFPGEAVPQFGLKIDRSGGAFDFSVSYSSVFDRIPDLKVLDSPTPGITSVGLAYTPVSVYGADCAFNIGSVGVRGELAYHQTRDVGGQIPEIKNPFTYFVLDTDYTLNESLKFGVQLHYKSILDWVDPTSFLEPQDVALAKTIGVIANQQSPSVTGISGRIGIRLLRETLSIDVAYMHWADTSNSIFRVRAGYSLDDSWKILLGGDFFDGPDDSFLGRYKTISGVIGELRRSF
jgi:hypothetical protein